MDSSKRSDTGAQRRTVLKLMSLAAGAGALSAVGAGQAEESDYAVVQGDRCLPVTPLSGDQPVEELYDWDEADTHYSSAGTTDLQRDDTSILFLYDGPNGTSLVLVHGHYRGDEENGGSVSMTFTGLPESGEWVVEDDRYDGDSNWDNWTHDGSRSEIDWTWRYNRTDGGAFRGLGDDAEIEIDPAFNGESTHGDEYYTSELTDWQVLSGDREDPDRTSLSMDQPIVIRAGGCGATDGSDGSGNTEEDDTDDGSDGSEEETTEETDEGGTDEGSTDEGDDVVVDEDTDGNVRAEGSIVVKSDVEIDGNVEAGADVEIESDGEVDGNIEAGGDVTVGSGSEIDGNVRAGGDVSVGSDCEIDGDVHANGAVTVRSESEIDGEVTGSDVDIADSAEVDGENGGEDARDREADSDEDSEDRRRTKHEKKKKKHEKKHEKRQRKHEKEAERERKKHRKKRRKHEKEEEKKERKHRKKRRKHEKEEEKKERKHRKKQRKHGKGNSAGVGGVLDDVTGLLDGDD